MCLFLKNLLYKEKHNLFLKECGLIFDQFDQDHQFYEKGIFVPGVEVPCFVMGMELVGRSKRTFAGILCWFFETSGYFLALGLAVLVPVTPIELTGTLPSFVFAGLVIACLILEVTMSNQAVSL